MITLTPGKHALVKVGFATRDSFHQGPGQSIPHRVSRSEGFAPHGKAFSRRVSHYIAMGHDDTCQGLCTCTTSACKSQEDSQEALSKL
jgi:hypothetical protein